MADTMQFDLVSPERKLASLAVRAVRIPGAEGDMTVMPGHAPVITTLRPGILTVTAAEGAETEYAVTGGFAEITGDSCTVLAEQSLARSEMTQAAYDQMLAQVRARLEEVKAQNLPGPTDEVVKLMADMVAMGSHIGLEAR